MNAAPLQERCAAPTAIEGVARHCLDWTHAHPVHVAVKGGHWWTWAKGEEPVRGESIISVESVDMARSV